MDNSIRAVRTEESDVGLDTERESTFSVANPSSRSIRLASALHTTSDLHSLVTFFAGELKGLMACEGIEYINDARGIHVVAGELRRHRCSYTLKTPDQSLGRMVFTRGKRFNRSELILLESLLGELFVPLQRALQRHQHRTLSSRFSTESITASEAYRSPPYRSSSPPERPAQRSRQESVPAGDLTLAPLGAVGEAAPPPRVAAIDTSRLTLAPLGSLGEAAQRSRPALMDTGGLTLAPLGPLSEASPAQRAAHIDTSHLSLAPDED
jgi:hypothetical protein